MGGNRGLGIVFTFNDGSLEYQVLRYELDKQGETINETQVDRYTVLQDWVNLVIGNHDDIIKIYLHFPYEFYVTSDIRTEILEAEHVHKRLRVIPYYEAADRTSIERRAANYGIKVEKPPIIEEKIRNHRERIERKALEVTEPLGAEFIDLKEIAERIAGDFKPGAEVEKVGNKVRRKKRKDESVQL